MVVFLYSIWMGREEDDSIIASEYSEGRGLAVGKNKACSGRAS